MKEHDESQTPETVEGEHFNTQEREAERGDAAEPDAPTSGEHNPGMSTVLSADPFSGVQGDAGDE
ncbi:MAG TPA: hypothetical protein VGB73_12760 [Pyrinomonadaceae bacterium]|jgi:hypothetical protein